MILPSQLAPPTTETAGFFMRGVEDFGRWLTTVLGNGWHSRTASALSLVELVELIKPRAPLSRHLLLPVAGWTVLLNDGPNGTDLGLLPTRATEQLGCCSVRAVSLPAVPGRYGATIMEVYDAAAAEAEFFARRVIYAVDDGGHWRFGESGERFTFEDADAYRRPRIRDRFTPDMLEQYLENLGVPINIEPDVGTSLLIERLS